MAAASKAMLALLLLCSSALCTKLPVQSELIYKDSIPDSSFDIEVPFFFKTSENQFKSVMNLNMVSDLKMSSEIEGIARSNKLKLDMPRIAAKFKSVIGSFVSKTHVHNVPIRKFRTSEIGVDVMIQKCFEFQQYRNLPEDAKVRALSTRLVKRTENLDFLVFPVIDQLLFWTEYFLRIGGQSVVIGRDKKYNGFYDIGEDQDFDQRYKKLTIGLSGIMKGYENSAALKAVQEKQRTVQSIKEDEVRIEDLSKQKDGLLARTKALQIELASLQQEKQKIKQKRDEARISNRRKKNELAIEAAALETNKKLLASKKESLASMVQSVKGEDVRIKDVSDQKNTLLAKTKSLQTELASLQEEEKKTIQKLDAIRSSNKTKENEIALGLKAETEKKRLLESKKENLGRIDTDIKGLATTESQKRVEQDRINAAIQQVSREISSLQLTLNQQEQKRAEMNSKKILNEEQLAQLARLCKDVNRFSEEKLQLSVQSATLGQQINSLSKELPKLKDHKRDLDEKKKIYEDELKRAKSQLELTEVEFGASSMKVQEAIRKKEHALKELQRLQKDLDKVHQEINELEDEKRRESILIESKKSAESQLHVLEREHQVLMERLEQAEIENAQRIFQLQAAALSNEAIQSKLALTDAENEEKSLNLAQRLQEVQTAQKLLQQADQDVVEMKKKLASVFDYLDELPLKNRWRIPPLLVAVVGSVFLLVFLLIILICIKAGRSSPSSSSMEREPISHESVEDVEAQAPPATPFRSSYRPKPRHGYVDDEPEEERRSYNSAPRGKPVMMH